MRHTIRKKNLITKIGLQVSNPSEIFNNIPCNILLMSKNLSVLSTRVSYKLAL